MHVLNPLMSRVLEKSEFVEADLTFSESREYPYLFNIAAFDETTPVWAVVSRVRLNEQGAKTHALALTFQEAHPTLEPAGVVTDWSDTPILGLGEAVGKVTAKALL